jgi:type IV pilus assembly protein PilC
MGKFKYKAKNQSGKIVEGVLEAENEAGLASLLRQRRLELVSSSASRGFGELFSFLTAGGITIRDLVIFSRQFSTMVNAGLPILQGLNILATQSDNKTFGAILGKIRDDISNGIPLSEAMSRHPKAFSTLYVNMVKAGEQGGILDTIFERLSEYMEKADGLQRKVKSAMMYPTIVMSVAVLIMIFLMVKVVPTFKDVFESFGAKLPPPTQLLVDISDFMASWRALVLLGVVVLIFTILQIYRRTKAGAYQFDALMMKLPVFGHLVRISSVAKFARTLGTLIKSGVPIMEAMETVGKTSGNLVVERAIMQARESLKEGKTLTEPLKKSGVFPPMVIQMINVGEETGALDNMLGKVADFYEDEVDTAVDGLTSIIEPILIVFLGVTVGFMVIAMFMPMFNMGNVVN